MRETNKGDSSRICNLVVQIRNEENHVDAGEMIHKRGEGNFFLEIQMELRNSNPVVGGNF